MRRPTAGWLLTLVAAAAVAAVVALNLPPRLPPTRSSLGAAAAAQAAPPPATGIATSWNAAAFRGLGSLAFVSHGLLYVMRDGTVTKVTRSGSAADPAWSHDGRWLAYTEGRQLWLVHAGGTDAHAVSGAAGRAGVFAWSPTSDVLAVAPAATGLQNGLWLVPTSGVPRPLGFAAQYVGRPAWSPDGTAIAADVFNPATKADTLYTVAAATGAATARFHAPAFTGLIVAGYSPDGARLAFWEDPQHSGSIALDGLQVETLDLATGAATPLPKTLVHPSWLAWSPDSRTLAMVEGTGREVWQNKGVVACDPTGRDGCPTLLRAPGTQNSYAPQFDDPGMVTLDPTWSPDGRTIAVVQAVNRGNVGGWGGCPQSTCSAAASQTYASRQLAAWLRTRVLWLLSPNGAETRPLRTAGTGIYDPQWSAGGGHIVYIRDGAIWEVPVAGGQAERVAGPIDAPYAPYGYYGYLNWRAGWAWYR